MRAFSRVGDVYQVVKHLVTDLKIWSRYDSGEKDVQVADEVKKLKSFLLYLSIPGEARRRQSRASLLLCK